MQLHISSRLQQLAPEAHCHTHSRNLPAYRSLHPAITLPQSAPAILLSHGMHFGSAASACMTRTAPPRQTACPQRQTDDRCPHCSPNCSHESQHQASAALNKSCTGACTPLTVRTFCVKQRGQVQPGSLRKGDGPGCCSSLLLLSALAAA